MNSDESETLSMIIDSLRKFVDAHIDVDRLDREHHLPDDILQKMKELGLFGLIIPRRIRRIWFVQYGLCSNDGGVGRDCTSLAVTVVLTSPSD